MKVFSFRNIRVLILLGILAAVAISQQDQRLSSTSWGQPIEAIIFPINGDGAPLTSKYIQQLKPTDFTDIEKFFARQSKRYKLPLHQPVNLVLGTTVNNQPPKPPIAHSRLAIIWWSLRLRWWAYRNTPDDKSNSNRIRLFVIYHQGINGQALAHSLGLQKGLLGIINAYARPKQTAQNNVIITHELLHTVGASDKYDLNTSLPLFPDGYAEPNRKPRYPQRGAEIMGGRIPLSATTAKMPISLRYCIIGKVTATEINWSK